MPTLAAAARVDDHVAKWTNHFTPVGKLQETKTRSYDDSDTQLRIHSEESQRSKDGANQVTTHSCGCVSLCI